MDFSTVWTDFALARKIKFKKTEPLQEGEKQNTKYKQQDTAATTIWLE